MLAAEGWSRTNACASCLAWKEERLLMVLLVFVFGAGFACNFCVFLWARIACVFCFCFGSVAWS